MTMLFKTSEGFSVSLTINAYDGQVAIKTTAIPPSLADAEEVTHIGLDSRAARKVAAELVRCADFIEHGPKDS